MDPDPPYSIQIFTKGCASSPNKTPREKLDEAVEKIGGMGGKVVRGGRQDPGVRTESEQEERALD